MGFPQTASNLSPEKLRIVLIRPSKYDEEGYVIRHLRGVLPSNTLACLYGLTEELRERQAFGSNIEIEIQILDDTVQKIPVRRIIKSNSPPHRRTIVALVGVQSNQFPRAADLARQFRESGLQVLIGGFHISGSLSLFPEIPPEIRELMDLGVAVVAGEVEETWVDILRDALEGRLQPLYNFLGCKPDLVHQAGAAHSPAVPAALHRPQLRHHRLRAGMSLSLQLLHHHQRAGPDDAFPIHGNDHPARSATTTTAMASITTSSRTTTLHGMPSGARSSRNLHDCAITKASPSGS